MKTFSLLILTCCNLLHLSSTYSSVVHTNYNSKHTSLGICLLVKDEEPNIIEWLDYHQSIGVTGVILVDYNSTIPMISPDVLKRIKSGFVVGYHYYYKSKVRTHQSHQLHLYNLCIRLYKRQFTHLAFIDADEFIVVKNRSATVTQVLEDYKDFGGLVLNWMIFGSNGHLARPPGGVLRNYNQCSTNCHVKSIIHTQRVASVSDVNHYFHYREGHHAVDTNKHKVEGPFNPTFNALDPNNFLKCYDVPETLYEVMYINHYVVKSLEDFEKKLMRGTPNKKSRDMTFFHLQNAQANSTCEYLEPGPMKPTMYSSL